MSLADVRHTKLSVLSTVLRDSHDTHSWAGLARWVIGAVRGGKWRKGGNDEGKAQGEEMAKDEQFRQTPSFLHLPSRHQEK